MSNPNCLFKCNVHGTLSLHILPINRFIFNKLFLKTLLDYKLYDGETELRKVISILQTFEVILYITNDANKNYQFIRRMSLKKEYLSMSRLCIIVCNKKIDSKIVASASLSRSLSRISLMPDTRSPCGKITQ